MDPIFYYDFNSPYAYLAAHRVDALLPVPARWQPIAFGALIGQIGKVPWSLQPGPGRDERLSDCAARAEALGLPLRWPEGWPDRNYSILVLRAALAADEHGRLREFSLAAFRHGLGMGRNLQEEAGVAGVAEEAGLDPAQILERAQAPEVKARLREATDTAIAAGVTGVPTVRIGDELFWGDDRLGEAAATLAAG